MLQLFDRPIIILSSPRAGSTLLFEIMTSCKDVWTIGDESHRVIESIPSLRIEKNNFSNRLDATNADDSISEKIKSNFMSELRDRDNNFISISTNSIRLLEKTPKNSLRIPFLNRIFPDAFFIYLVRDPCENISSIIDAWRARRWITYDKLPNRDKPWSLLLPPHWESVSNKSLEVIAAFQWASSNEYILNDLKQISPDRWTTISYHELLNDTNSHIKRLCKFCEVEFDEVLNKLTSNQLPHSKYTLAEPSADKWKKNKNEISNIYSRLSKIITEIDNTLTTNRETTIQWITNTPIEKVSRNASCPCGSGKKYKRCHGSPNHSSYR